jgi:hypothetical protein
MVEDLRGGWIGFSPYDENARNPVAKVTFELLPDEPGDLRAGFEVYPNGPFGRVSRTPEERRAAFLKISELVEAEVDRWMHLYRGDAAV